MRNLQGMRSYLPQRITSNRLILLLLCVGLLFSLSVFLLAVSSGYSFQKFTYTPPDSFLLLNFDLYPPIHAIIYCTFTLWIGYSFLKSFLSFEYRSLILLAAFMPGYFIVVAINRLVTIIFPNNIALPLLCLVYGAIIGYGVFAKCKFALFSVGRVTLTHVIRTLCALFNVLFIIVIFLIITSPLVTGDATSFYSDLIRNGAASSSRYFPVVGTHYDEILFLYPLIKTHINYIMEMHEHKPWNFIGSPWYWVMNSFGKASCFAILLLSLRSISGSKYFALALSVLIFVGAVVATPAGSVYHNLIDSKSPLVLSTHIARQFIAITPALVVALIFNNFKTLNNLSVRNPACWIMCLGLSAVPAHFLPVVLASAGIAIANLFSSNSVLAPLTIVLSLFTAICLFLLPSYQLAGIVGLEICVLASIFIIWRATFMAKAAYKKHHLEFPQKTKNTLRLLLMFIWAYSAGFFALGNLLITERYEILGLPLTNIKLRNYDIIPMQFGNDVFVNCRMISMIQGFSNFANAYGLPFILSALCSLILLAQNKMHALNNRRPNFNGLAIGMTLLLLSFFVFLFLSGDGKICMGVWTKSRFVEPWFYYCIITSLIMIYNYSNNLMRYALFLMVMVFIFTRHLLSPDLGIFGSFLKNGAIIARHLF